MRDDRQRLLDILEAIGGVERYAARGHDAFRHDELLQVWMVHHLQIIGEAAAGLSSAFRESHADVPWVDIIALRNVVVHQYFGVDLQQIWDTVEQDVPALKVAVEVLLSDHKCPPSPA